MKFAALSLTLFLGFISFANDGYVDPSKQIIAALKANPIVSTAVAVAKQDSGSEVCEYSVAQAFEVEGFASGTVYDYAAVISCGVLQAPIEQARAQVKVQGRIFYGRIDTLKLSLDFFE